MATSCFTNPNKHVVPPNSPGDPGGSDPGSAPALPAFQPSSLPALTRKVVSLRADLPEGRPKLAHDLSEHDAIDTTMGPNRHSVVKPDGDGT